MALPTGSSIGPYEIVSVLGAGGMGEVYRARDTNLGREVALKALPDALARDPERLARFRREAHVLAALNHPHIAGIYGVEEANGQPVLVLELVDGETLATRVARGALPVQEALAIARDIAEALEAAHETGIIHRDLKPANIALTPHDRVKVLDFGLAKVADAAGQPGGRSSLDSPTLTSPAMLTELGMILGTAAYMSPEQAKGRAADKRSDVWAFGCVLYEMLTGQRAFKGDDVSDTLASVLKSEPAWEALPGPLPRSIRALLEGCLQKNPRERISDISTALFVLKGGLVEPVEGRARARAMPSKMAALLLVLGGAAAGVSAAIALWPRAAVPDPAVTRFAISVPEDQPLTLSRRMVAVSPDGTRIVYVASGRLYLRALSDDESRPIPGADPAVQPTFSPDGESIVFWSDPSLKRISVNGGAPVTVCETTPAPFGIDWSDSGIVFVQLGTGIMRVSPDGGTPETLVRAVAAEGLIHGPQLLPDGDTLLFTVTATRDASSPTFWDKGKVVAQSVRTGQRTTVVEDGTDARYLATGHLVYMVEGTMMAVPFDLRRMKITGGAAPVVEGIRRSPPSVGFAAQFAFSKTGVLVYVAGPARAGRDDIFLFDRNGYGTPLKLRPGSYAYPRASPDGRRLAFETTDGRQSAIALYELSGTSSVRRLTFGGNNRLPIWSADGKRVAFQSDREGDRAIFWQPVAGGVAERLTRPDAGTSHVPESWSPQGDVFLFSVTRGSEISLWTFSVRERKASRFDEVTSAGVPTNAVFSSDGKWVAYQAGQDGAAEATTYVQPFPPTGEKFEIARGGRALWSRDGKELFFVPAPSEFRAVSVSTTPTFQVSTATVIPRRFGMAPPASPRPYDILPDGRFVAVDTAAQPGTQHRTQRLNVVLNWFETLKKNLPSPRG